MELYYSKETVALKSNTKWMACNIDTSSSLYGLYTDRGHPAIFRQICCSIV